MSTNVRKTIDQSKLPNLPGFRIDVDLRNNFAKSHVFDMKNGIPVTDLQRTGINGADKIKEMGVDLIKMNPDASLENRIKETPGKK